MQVRNFAEKLRYWSKLGVGLNLLEVCLCQACRIIAIQIVRPAEQVHVPLPDLFGRNQGALHSLAFWLEREDIAPGWFRVIRAISQVNLKSNLWVASCVQAAQLGDPASIAHGLLQAATLGLADVPEKAKSIEQIRLTCGVRS